MQDEVDIIQKSVIDREEYVLAPLRPSVNFVIPSVLFGALVSMSVWMGSLPLTGEMLGGRYHHTVSHAMLLLPL